MAYTTQQIQSLIIQEARRQGVDPALALGIAQAESSFNPHAVGDNGRSIGLFQLQPAGAIDAGGDPRQRYEVPANIRLGIAYLKNRVAREGGQEDRGISAYNQGVGLRHGQLSNPQYVSTVRTYQQRFQQQPSLLTRVSRALSPASAEAAALPDRAPGGGLPDLPARPPPYRGTGQAPGPRPGQAAAAAGRSLPALPDLPDHPPAAPAPPAPAAPAADPRAGYEVEVIPGSTGTPAASSAATQVQLLQQQEQGRLAAEQAVGSPTRPARLPVPEGILQTPQGQIDYNAYLPQPALPPGTGGPMAGELIGQQVGTLTLGPGFGTAMGGALGAGTGSVAEDVARRQSIDWRKAASEVLWSAVPEVGESLLRGVAMRWLRGIPGGRAIRMDEAARRARLTPEAVYTPLDRQQIGAAFDAVRQSGVYMDLGAMRQQVQALSPGKFADVMYELRQMDRVVKTGQRYQDLFNNLRQTGGTHTIQGMAIGDLQQLRSLLRERVDQVEHTEARQLMRDVQTWVDDAIDSGLTRGRVPAGQVPAQLREARQQWQRLRASEELAEYIELKVTGTPDMQLASLNFRSLADELRRNVSRRAQQINRSLDHTPGARAAFMREMDEVAELYRTIEMPLNDVAGARRSPYIAWLSSALSQWMTHDPALFREAILNGRGALSPNAVAAGANQARRAAGLEPLPLPWEEKGAAAPTPPAARSSGG